MKNATATTLIDRTTAVLSIRPVYADRILDGTKRVEFRRKELGFGVTSILIWRTGKDGGFVGHFTIPLLGVTWQTARAWGRLPHIGVNPDDLIAYAGGPDEMVWGYSVANLTVFPRTYAGWELGTDSPPQFFRYAHANWRDALLEAAKS